MSPAPSQRPVAKKTEEKSLFWRMLPWVFIVVGIGSIAIMIYFNPPLPRLNCIPVLGGTGLTAFGSCTTD